MIDPAPYLGLAVAALVGLPWPSPGILNRRPKVAISVQASAIVVPSCLVSPHRIAIRVTGAGRPVVGSPSRLFLLGVGSAVVLQVWPRVVGLALPSCRWFRCFSQVA